jgi:putative PIG3 family NAD(P)H quinone oxidoreductase
MRALVLEAHDGPDSLALREIPDPAAGPEEVVVDVASAGVNRADLLQTRGRYPGPPMPHEIPGLELAGRVVSVGERATRWALGDAVMGIVAGGAYAERIAVHERQLLPLPPAIALEDAGAVPEVFVTAWDAFVQGGLTSGRVVLVHAGASGVGTAAIQIAKAMGAVVVATASARKVHACRALGADVVVDYGADDFVPAVKALGGADVVLDVVGGDYLARNLDALRTGGSIVQVGTMGGGSATFPLGAILPKRATIIGTVLRGRPLEEKIAVTQRFEREVLPWLADGTVKPVIDARYAMADAPDAHRRMEANDTIGKLVLQVAAISAA